MKRIALTAVLACTATTMATAGLAEYSVELSSATAALGDVIDVTVHLDLDPQATPFTALSLAAFNVTTTDTQFNSINNVGPGLGLAPAFVPLGNPGAIVLDDIVGIQAGQFPPTVFDTSLDLYTFQYTVTDDTPRNVDFSIDVIDTVVFGSSVLDPVSYDSISGSATLQVGGVPAPGALALLGIAGLTGFRRRRA